MTFPNFENKTIGMRKIKNVHIHEDPEKYNCFGCSPNNKLGLQLEFWEDGDEVFAIWEPQPNMMGWYDVVHGGIQATLMDEVSGWLVYVKCATAGVTFELNAKYRKPLLLSNGPIKVKSKLVERNRKFAVIDSLVISNNEVCAEGKLTFYLYPENIARSQFHYPGVDAFFESE